MQSYGHANLSTAHPLGANFYEINSILSYRKDRHRLTNRIVYSGYGADTSSISYGQNVFESYSNREGEYDHFIMQGLKHNVLSAIFTYEYQLIPKAQLYLTAQYKWRHDRVGSHVQNNHFIQFGLKSRIWNKYTDI